MDAFELEYDFVAEDIVKLLSRPRTPIPNSKRNPFSGGAKCTGVGIFYEFRLNSPRTTCNTMV